MSIQANELRIGNLIYIKCVAREVMDDEFEIQECNINNIKSIFEGNKDFLFKPIPLTEEWLLNFGFGIDEEYDNTFIDNTSLKNEIIRVSIDSHYFTIELFCGQVLEIPNIKYVHQLQNLYFALTGEELTIKQ